MYILYKALYILYKSLYILYKALHYIKHWSPYLITSGLNQFREMVGMEPLNSTSTKYFRENQSHLLSVEGSLLDKQLSLNRKEELALAVEDPETVYKNKQPCTTVKVCNCHKLL